MGAAGDAIRLAHGLVVLDFMGLIVVNLMVFGSGFSFPELIVII